MNRKRHFIFTDVFAESKYAGNPLATFLDGSSLSGGEMLQITREINFSETTFILPDEGKDGGFRVRIFTPGSEVDFAGHPTLGTAWVIRQHLIRKPVDPVVLNLNVGPVPVTWPDPDDGNSPLFMEQVEPSFDEHADQKTMAGVLNLNPDDLDSRWPVQSVSTGLPHFIVAVKDLKTLKKVRVNLDLYWALINQSETKSILVFCPEGYDASQALAVRVFGDYYGVPEDPATGSGNGCLAAFLVKYRYYGSDTIDIRTGQGYEIGRPSTLVLRASKQGESIQVKVGGRVVPVAEGYWE